jgi:hypothetical protein
MRLRVAVFFVNFQMSATKGHHEIYPHNPTYSLLPQHQAAAARLVPRRILYETHSLFPGRMLIFLINSEPSRRGECPENRRTVKSRRDAGGHTSEYQQNFSVV